MLSRFQGHLSKTASSYVMSGTRAAQSSNNRTGSSLLANSTQRRCYTENKRPTGSNDRPDPSSSASGSQFSYENSMDELFGDLDKTPFTSHPRKASTYSKSRQTMTERETKVLTGMLDMIFASKSSETKNPDTTAAAASKADDSGIGPVQVDDLFDRLRRFSSKSTVKPRTKTTELLDEKKEEMSYCTDDRQLLEWAAREVFDESVRYEAAAKRVIQENSESESAQKPVPPLQSPIYPKMIAHLMRTFRVQYRDPNLALFIFKYAQNLSIASYVFGCSTDAYNELIETRWSSFGDLKGLHDAINEMEVNAVPVNNKTHKLLDEIRRDLGKKDLNTSESEEWRIMASIEDTMSRMDGEKKKQQTRAPKWDSWKREALDDDDGGFDDWSSFDTSQPDTWQSQGRLAGRDPGRRRRMEGNSQSFNRSFKDRQYLNNRQSFNERPPRNNYQRTDRFDLS